MLLQRPYHPKWSTELIQALPKFQGHFLQKETKWWFERRNSGCRVYDDLFVERWQKCASFRALPINTALSCSPDLLDRTLHNFPVWQESTYIKQRQSEETPVVNIKGGRGGSRMTEVFLEPAAVSWEEEPEHLSRRRVACTCAPGLRSTAAPKPSSDCRNPNSYQACSPKPRDAQHPDGNFGRDPPVSLRRPYRRSLEAESTGASG